MREHIKIIIVTFLNFLLIINTSFALAPQPFSVTSDQPPSSPTTQSDHFQKETLSEKKPAKTFKYRYLSFFSTLSLFISFSAFLIITLISINLIPSDAYLFLISLGIGATGIAIFLIDFLVMSQKRLDFSNKIHIASFITYITSLTILILIPIFIGKINIDILTPIFIGKINIDILTPLLISLTIATIFLFYIAIKIIKKPTLITVKDTKKDYLINQESLNPTLITVKDTKEDYPINQKSLIETWHKLEEDIQRVFKTFQEEPSPNRDPLILSHAFRDKEKEGTLRKYLSNLHQTLFDRHSKLNLPKGMSQTNRAMARLTDSERFFELTDNTLSIHLKKASREVKESDNNPNEWIDRLMSQKYTFDDIISLLNYLDTPEASSFNPDRKKDLLAKTKEWEDHLSQLLKNLKTFNAQVIELEQTVSYDKIRISA
ncbi:hypothetical protein AB834_03180 [PVC group bacterium (ex Bugula neritina AB1)]|nr:hypothetical protein AB834_03180 [PVC group bacterium (ex Bugula neritina AB1)]